MNKQVNFEDTIFILNIRIRMIRDLLKLDIDPGLFLQKTLDDMDFTGHVLETLVGNLLANPRFLDRDLEFDNLLDAELQFNQLLAEFTAKSSPFSISIFPETRERILRLREESEGRQKLIDNSFGQEEHNQAEPLVSSAELSELLNGI
ncbi:hypothetical protein AGMMS50293_20060 [Spirochaetia bacterium]|nr:hypothetical protein AGMMS50293_20060 [Spirochaetia bacterium]